MQEEAVAGRGLSADAAYVLFELVHVLNIADRAVNERLAIGAFQAERTAFFASVHGRYTVGTPRSDLTELMGWLPAGAPACYLCVLRSEVLIYGLGGRSD